MREIPGIKRVFVRSGIRYDYMRQDKDRSFFKELVKYHISVSYTHLDVYKRQGQ